MSYRVNHHEEALIEHINEREWSEEDKNHFLHMIGRSALMSAQGVLTVLEFQQATDERIEAEKQADQVFSGQGWGNGMGVPVVERTEVANDHFQQRFEETL